MAKPLTDFARLIGRVFWFLRFAGVVLLALTVWFIGREVSELSEWAGRIHPALEWIVIAVALGLAIRLLGVPLYRFLKMPVMLTPPDLPDGDTRAAVKRLDYLARYLGALRKNPLLAETRPEVERVRREALTLRAEVTGRSDPKGSLMEFERERVDPLLRPLDREADRVIRAEALSVGVATAISPNGTLDAALVLWRNANLVSRVANIYYGRPGVRGSFLILRDVSSAALLATYLEGLSEVAGGVLQGILGSVAGIVAGPLVDGSINAVATLRVGYLAKGRCRSFSAWTDATRREALAEAVAAAKERSGGIIREIVKRAGAGLGGVGDVVRGGFAAFLRALKREDPGPAAG